MPAEGSASCLPCPVTDPDPREAAKGSEVRIVRCVIHGIAFDTEREACPECAKGVPARCV